MADDGRRGRVSRTPAETLDELPVERRLCLAVHSAARAMDAVYRPLLQASGLTYPQYLVMSVLWEDGNQGVGALAHRLALDSSTMSPLLRRLEARGLLRRDRDDADQRKVAVRLTDAGVKAQQQVRGITDAVCSASGLSLDQQEALVAHLHELAATLLASTHADTDS